MGAGSQGLQSKERRESVGASLEAYYSISGLIFRAPWMCVCVADPA